MVEHKHSKDIIGRLARVEGHVRAVRQMVEEGRPCPDILIQVSAVRAAVERVGRLILEDHLESCLLDASRQGEIEKALAEMKDALGYFIP
ncbi:MAG: metal-sensing transcriptional repressor [Dehalococcoidia bacterium]|nr:metal-sensing transcriptional repressor [Dehalococcoidia bacterium]